MDQRNMRQIHVTWQLMMFLVAIFALPISLAPVFTAVTEERVVPRSVLTISCSIAVALFAMMVLAVWSRAHQARLEEGPDGRPLSAWVLRQVSLGLLLCVVGAGILALMAWMGASRRFAAIFCTVAAGPGIILIGRALAPPK